MVPSSGAEPKATPDETPLGEQILAAPVLPDSRLSNRGLPTPRGGRQTTLGWSVPIYCANCGTPGGFVPQDNCDFAYWTCDECYQALGDLVNTYVMPDEVFFERIKQEQLTTYGRELSITELQEVVAADASPLATLLTSRRTLGG